MNVTELFKDITSICRREGMVLMSHQRFEHAMNLAKDLSESKSGLDASNLFNNLHERAKELQQDYPFIKCRGEGSIETVTGQYVQLDVLPENRINYGCVLVRYSIVDGMSLKVKTRVNHDLDELEINVTESVPGVLSTSINQFPNDFDIDSGELVCTSLLDDLLAKVVFKLNKEIRTKISVSIKEQHQ